MDHTGGLSRFIMQELEQGPHKVSISKAQRDVRLCFFESLRMNKKFWTVNGRQCGSKVRTTAKLPNSSSVRLPFGPMVAWPATGKGPARLLVFWPRVNGMAGKKKIEHELTRGKEVGTKRCTFERIGACAKQESARRVEGESCIQILCINRSRSAFPVCSPVLLYDERQDGSAEKENISAPSFVG
jgi:hypothetical protein